jgi:hypothetical protein
VQRYVLPLDQLRIADLSSADLSPFVSAVMDFCEAWGIEGRVGPASEEFSRLVSRIVQRAGFDGMKVPGVRGNTSLHYCNVVVFKPGDKWREWSLQDSGFSPE